jgi:hypothetical protein
MGGDFLGFLHPPKAAALFSDLSGVGKEKVAEIRRNFN